MRGANNKIGFDDRLVMLIAIPILSFIIPFVFMGCRFDRYPLFSWDKYLTTLVITAVIWSGNRFIMIYSRNKYPLFEDVRRRLIFQSAYMFVFTVVSNNLMGILADDIFSRNSGPRNMSDVLINSNAAALFCTITIIAIYESIYFMSELRKSVEETENLKRESLSAQLNALRTQVNPHFLFNNLNTLCSLIPENPTHAVNFVQELSKVYRHILEVKDEKSILLMDELKVLNAYAFLLKTRFGNNLEVNINVPEDKMKKKIVPLSLQLLMENAIKHNIVDKATPLSIDISSIGNYLVVSNNLQGKKIVETSNKQGLDNLRSLYRFLTDNPVVVEQTDTRFAVKVPLV